MVHHGVEFAVVEGFRPLLLDLYLPTRGTSAASAAVVYLHGGGWAVGTRRRFGRAFASWSPTALDRLAQAGFVVATVDYRLSGEAHFPAQLHDVKAAIRWLRGNAAPLGVDPARVIAWGESAGGHLAMLAGLTGDRPELEGDVGEFVGESSAVCGVVDWYGPMNLLSLSSQHRSRQRQATRRRGLVGVDDGRRAAADRPGAHAGSEPDLVRARRRASRSRSTTAPPTPRCRSRRASSSSKRCEPPVARSSWSSSKAATTSGPAPPTSHAIFDASAGLRPPRHAARDTVTARHAVSTRYDSAGMTSSANMRIDRWVSALLIPG